LDKELQKVTFDLSGGANRTDLLARLLLENGNSELVLCHTEVQQDRGEGEKAMYMSAFEKIYRKEERRDIARNMLSRGFPVEQVAECTMLPREEVEKLLDLYPQ
jgi:hypothetical protein